MLTKHIEILNDDGEVLWMRTSTLHIRAAKKLMADLDGELTEKGKEVFNSVGDSELDRGEMINIRKLTEEREG